MAVSVKPCPFCGSEAKIIKKTYYNVIGGSQRAVFQMGCKAKQCKVKPKTSSFRSEATAIQVWNERVT